MRCLGADTSTSCTALVLLDHEGEIVDRGVWKPSPGADDAKALIKRLYEVYKWMDIWMGLRKNLIDAVCVEEMSFARNTEVVKTLSHVEAAAMIASKKRGFVTIRAKPGEIRSAVLGIPANSSKEAAHVALAEQFPNVTFPPKNQGGWDQKDAFLAARSIPDLIGRRT